MSSQVEGASPPVQNSFIRFDEGPDDVDAHLDRAWATEDVGGHDGTVFGEGVRKISAATLA
jgi:hypothetical protein